MTSQILAVQPGFMFVGDALAADFANTFGNLPPDSISQERLRSYRHLAVWAYEAGLVTESEGQELLSLARAYATEAEAVLDRARTVRDAIRAIFAALANNTPPTTDALKALNRELEQAMAGGWVVRAANGFAWDWPRDGSALDVMIAPVVRAAALMLVFEAQYPVRQCANPACSHLFVDRSKNHNRQWCSAATCGNQARVRKYRERQGRE